MERGACVESQPLHHATSLLCAVLFVWLGCQAVVAFRRPVARSGVVPQALNHRLDVNTADADDLALLPGVGPITARRIVAYRTAHGRFTDPGQLGRVKMIGPVTCEKIEPWITVGDRKPAQTPRPGGP